VFRDSNVDAEIASVEGRRMAVSTGQSEITLQVRALYDSARSAPQGNIALAISAKSLYSAVQQKKEINKETDSGGRGFQEEAATTIRADSFLEEPPGTIRRSPLNATFLVRRCR
jgi:hypothetical protein